MGQVGFDLGRAMRSYCSLPLASSVNITVDSYWLQYAQQTKNFIFRLVSPLDVQTRCTFGPLADQYIVEVGPCIVFPMGVWGFVSGFGFRACSTKDFNTFTTSPLVLYTAGRSWGVFPTLTYQSPIILSEGVMDAEMLSFTDAVSIAYLGSAVSGKTAEFLSCLSCNIFIIPDNDKAGDSGFKISQKNFSKHGVNLKRLPLPKNFKDPGEMAKQIASKIVLHYIQGLKTIMFA